MVERRGLRGKVALSWGWGVEVSREVVFRPTRILSGPSFFSKRKVRVSEPMVIETE